MINNFFQSFADLDLKGNFNMVIRREESGDLFVTTQIQPDNPADTALRHVPPIILKGTPAEFDTSFFEKLAAPLKYSSDLFFNMNEYAAGLEKAKQQSKMEKDKSEKGKKAAEDAKKLYGETMKKLAQFEQEEKYAEAIALIENPEDFPGKEEEIKKKLAALKTKVAGPTLF